MQRRMLIAVDAPPAAVTAAAVEHLGLGVQDDGSLAGRLPGDDANRGFMRLTLSPSAEPNRVDVTLEAGSDLRVPYFQWFFGPLLVWFVRRHLRHASSALRTAAAGQAPSLPPTRPMLLAPVGFDDRQVHLLASASAIGALATFGAALFGQNSDAIARSFGASDASLGVALAVTRVGVLVALVATALADRKGRRLLLVLSFAGLCLANAATALAPNLAFFTGAQLVTRAFVNATLVVAGIAVVEDAPRGARAFAAAMFALASGAGFAVSVILLPLTDLGPDAWRIAFGVSGLSILTLPILWRSLPETRRYEALAARTERRGRVREVFDRSYGPRFALLAAAAFLTNVFSAPSAQLANRYLIDERGFNNTGVAVLRAVTNGLPGLLGVVIGGRLAETRGRRPVAVIALIAGTLVQMVFFLSSGILLWLASTVAIVGAASATLAVGTLDAELFPTEVRGTSNALLLVCYVTGSAVGLFLAGALADPLGGLGRSIALCGIAPLVAAIFFLPRLPESAHRGLEDVSPSEV